MGAEAPNGCPAALALMAWSWLAWLGAGEGWGGQFWPGRPTVLGRQGHGAGLGAWGRARQGGPEERGAVLEVGS